MPTEEFRNQLHVRIGRYIARTMIAFQIILIILNFLNYITLPFYLLYLPILYITVYFIVMTIIHYDQFQDVLEKEQSGYNDDIFKYLTEEEKAQRK
ncbi:MAG: hypothetical protein WC877_02035 [Dehalococcoidales bacterium]